MKLTVVPEPRWRCKPRCGGRQCRGIEPLIASSPQVWISPRKISRHRSIEQEPLDWTPSMFTTGTMPPIAMGHSSDRRIASRSPARSGLSLAPNVTARGGFDDTWPRSRCVAEAAAARFPLLLSPFGLDRRRESGPAPVKSAPDMPDPYARGPSKPSMTGVLALGLVSQFGFRFLVGLGFFQFPLHFGSGFELGAHGLIGPWRDNPEHGQERPRPKGDPGQQAGRDPGRRRATATQSPGGPACAS